MYTIINMVNMTDYISPDSEDNGSDQNGKIDFNASLSDPASTFDFVVDDINQTLNIQNFMPVIVFDENVPSLNTRGGVPVPTVPSMNFVINVLFETSGGWTKSGTLSSLVTFTNGGPNVTMTFNNNAVGSGLASQQTLSGYVQPGVEYMWSIYITGSGTINNIQALLQVTFQDIFGNTLGSTISQAFTPTLTQQQINITGTAPANAAYASISFGGQTTNTTNSGTITFATPQFEPMWFTEYGVSYPTPDCNFNQANSIIMPDGTTSRACRIFAGYVEDHTNSYVGKQRHTTVQCASASKLLETAGLVSFSVTNTQDTSVLNTALGDLPTNDNIIGTLATGQQNLFAPSSTLIPGVVVDSMSFTNSTIREVCNNLSAQSGSIFYVDPYYYLWYVPPSFAGTTIMLSDTPDYITSFPYYDFSVEYDSTNPVNTALVVGSKQKAAVLTDVFNGDGVTTLFGLSFPPENTHAVTVGGATVRTGVDGIDNSKFGSSSTYKALINKQAPTIKFATAPASGSGNVSVSYTYEDQVISQVIAADAVAQQKASFWGLVSDSNITSTKAAKNRGLSELQSYAFPRTILTLSALNIYIPVGGLILFTCQSENMTNEPFVVQTVESDPQGGGVYSWNYTAGVYNPSMIDHLRNVTKAVKKTPTTANVVVIASIDVALFDTTHLNDAITTTQSNYASAVGVDNPVVYYRLGETFGTSAYDLSSNGHTGTINGGVTLNQTGALFGDTNKAMLFNGSTGWISSTASIASGSGTWSIEAWVKKSGAPSVLSVIASFGTWGTANETAFLAIDTSGFAQIGTYSGNHSSSVSVVDGAWHYLLGTYNGTNMNLYIDGNTTPAVSVAQTMALTGTSVAVASSPGSLHDPLAGTVDEVAFYNYQLSTSRMTAHYNAGI